MAYCIPMRRILLIEDWQDDAQLTIHTLRTSQIVNPVDHVVSAEDALAYLTRAGMELPVFVLLDLKLPGRDGFWLLQEMRNHDQIEIQLIPVAVFTNSKEDEDRIKSLKAGANTYVRKPLDFIALRQVGRDLELGWAITDSPPKSEWM